MSFATARKWIAGTLAGALSLSAAVVVAQTEVSSETVDERAPYVQLVEDLERELDEALLKNRELERKVKNLSSAMGVLAERESETKRELEELRESHEKAVVNLELFSVALQRDGGEGVKEMLLKAASDLRLVEDDKERVAQGLLELMGAVEDYMKTAEKEGQVVEELVPMKDALRASEEALGLVLSDDEFNEKTIADARVITVKKEYSLVLVNVGRRQGLRVGTPISLIRKDRTVGSALIIDVRDAFCGAIFDLSDPNDQIMVGDSIRIDPEGV